ncbi:hypothetical protein ACHWUR_24150 [Klebsiella pneumoniae]
MSGARLALSASLELQRRGRALCAVYDVYWRGSGHCHDPRASVS